MRPDLKLSTGTNYRTRVTIEAHHPKNHICSTEACCSFVGKKSLPKTQKTFVNGTVIRERGCRQGCANACAVTPSLREDEVSSRVRLRLKLRRAPLCHAIARVPRRRGCRGASSWPFEIARVQPLPSGFLSKENRDVQGRRVVDLFRWGWVDPWQPPRPGQGFSDRDQEGSDRRSTTT